MANNTNNIRTGVIDIPGALRPLGGADSSTNQVGGVVAYTGDIYDVDAERNQAEINDLVLNSDKYIKKDEHNNIIIGEQYREERDEPLDCAFSLRSDDNLISSYAQSNPELASLIQQLEGDKYILDSIAHGASGGVDVIDDWFDGFVENTTMTNLMNASDTATILTSVHIDENVWIITVDSELDWDQKTAHALTYVIDTGVENRFYLSNNGSLYIKGVGGWDGRSEYYQAQPLQSVLENAGSGGVTDVQVKEYDEDSYATVVDANGVAKIDLSSIDDQIDTVNNLIGVNDHHGDLFTRMQAVEKQTEKSSDCQIDVQPIFSYIEVTGDGGVYKVVGYENNPMNQNGVKDFLLNHNSSVYLCTYIREGNSLSPDYDSKISIEEAEIDEDDNKLVITLDEDLGQLEEEMLGVYCTTNYMSIAYGTYLTASDSVVVGQSNITNGNSSVSIGRGNYSQSQYNAIIGGGNESKCYLNGFIAGFDNTLGLSTQSSIVGSGNAFRACNGSFVGGSYNTSMSALLDGSVKSGGNCVGYSNYMSLFYYNVLGQSNTLTAETSELFDAYDDGDYHMGQVIGKSNTIIGGLGNNVIGSNNSMTSGNPCESNVHGHHNTFAVSGGICIGNDNSVPYQGNPIQYVINVGNENTLNGPVAAENAAVVGHKNTFYSPKGVCVGYHNTTQYYSSANPNIINVGNENVIFGEKTISVGNDNKRIYGGSQANPITMIGHDLTDDYAYAIYSQAESGYGWSLYDTTNSSSPGVQHVDGATILGTKNCKRTFDYYRDGIFQIGCGGANDTNGKTVFAVRATGDVYIPGVGGWDGTTAITPLMKSINEYFGEIGGQKPLETSEVDSFYKYMSLPAVDLYIHTMSVSGHNNYLLEIYTTSNIELVDVATLKHYDPNVSGKVKVTTSVSLTNSSEQVTTSVYNGSPFTVASTVTGTMPRWCGDMFIPTISSGDYDELNKVAISGTYLKYIFIPNAFVKDANDNVYRAVWHNIGQSYTKGISGATILGTSPCNAAGTHETIMCMPLNGTINKPNDL